MTWAVFSEPGAVSPVTIQKLVSLLKGIEHCMQHYREVWPEQVQGGNDLP